MSGAPQVVVRERPEPVLLGERARRVREALAGGAVPVVLLLGLGLVFLVAGLVPTTASFTDEGTAYEATCGIETVLAGSTWERLDAACGRGGGLRTVAVAGGAVLLVGGAVHLGRTAVRAGAPGSSTRSLPRPLRRSGRAAVLGAVVGAVVAGGATLVLRARLDAAALAGDCLPGSGSCADHRGWAGVVQVGGIVVALACVGVLVHLAVAPRRRSAQLGSALLVAGAALLLLGVRPVTVDSGSGTARLRATCGVEVLVAGHPQASVTSACRGAAGSRAAAGVAGATLAGVGGVLLWRARPPRDDVDGGDSGTTASPLPRARRTQPLRAGAGVPR